MPVSNEKCGLKKCNNLLGPGAAAIGFEINGKVQEVRVCSNHAWTIMAAPRGTFNITEDRELVKIPAKPLFFT